MIRIPPLGEGASAGVMAAATNTVVAMAPNLPGNELGVGGVDVNFVALALNGLVTPFKMNDWFNQNKWMPALLLVFAIAVSLLVFQDDIRKAVLNGLAAIPTAMSNYAAQKPVAIIPRGTDPVIPPVGGGLG